MDTLTTTQHCQSVECSVSLILFVLVFIEPYWLSHIVVGWLLNEVEMWWQVLLMPKQVS